MLAALSLGKRPIKMQNLKSLRLFRPSSHEHPKRICIKVHSIESKLVIRPSDNLYCLGAGMCALFTLEILQAGAVKGLINSD